MQALRVDPEFQNKIPPISEDEFKQLRENILEAGEVYEPLVIWNGVIVDGHNRWKVIQENPSVKYRVREIPFPDKWAAFEWMYRNQLGRRNLTDEQRAYTIGKMYEARKKSKGNNAERGDDGKYLIAQKDPSGDTSKSTAAAIGREVGLAEPTVKRKAEFAKGVDALREVSPEAAEKVLSGKANVPWSDIRKVGRMKPEEVKAAADVIVSGKRIEKPDKPAKKNDSGRPQGANEGFSSDARKLKQIISEAYAPMLDTSAPSTYDINDLCEEIDANGKTYTQQLHRTIENRRGLLNDDEARKAVKNAINHIIQAIVKELNRV